ncbi:MAG TPA: VOC family protein [Gemmatimonadaceae bacterium]|nr:VOC family protein [Gemmatimonadaceae bacterium]
MTSAIRVAWLAALSVCGASTLALAAHAQPPGTTCHAAKGTPQLDHAVVAVRDLDATRDALQDAGFVVKRGRDHADGLRNAHVKFSDGTSLEFMTLTGPPSSEIARSYAERLARGDRGAFVALSVPTLDAVERAARGVGLETVRTRSGAWSFLSFTATSDAAALFFVTGGAPSVDPDSLLAHTSGAAGGQAARSSTRLAAGNGRAPRPTGGGRPGPVGTPARARRPC